MYEHLYNDGAFLVFRFIDLVFVFAVLVLFVVSCTYSPVISCGVVFALNVTMLYLEVRKGSSVYKRLASRKPTL